MARLRAGPVAYGLAIVRAWTALGHADSVGAQLRRHLHGEPERTPRQLAELDLLPPWLGRDDLHRSHRSALVRKMPSFYRPRFPDVPDDLPYVWPE